MNSCSFSSTAPEYPIHHLLLERNYNHPDSTDPARGPAVMPPPRVSWRQMYRDVHQPRSPRKATPSSPRVKCSSIAAQRCGAPSSEDTQPAPELNGQSRSAYLAPPLPVPSPHPSTPQARYRTVHTTLTHDNGNGQQTACKAAGQGQAALSVLVRRERQLYRRVLHTSARFAQLNGIVSLGNSRADGESGRSGQGAHADCGSRGGQRQAEYAADVCDGCEGRGCVPSTQLTFVRDCVLTGNRYSGSV